MEEDASAGRELRVLYVSPYLPWPLHGGPEKRVFHLLRGLKQDGHRVELVAGHENEGPGLAEELEEVTTSVRLFPVPTRPRAVEIVRSLISPRPYPADRRLSAGCRSVVREAVATGPSVVVVGHSFMLEALPPSEDTPAPVVLDQHESLESLWSGVAGEGTVLRRAFGSLNLWKARRGLPRWLERADAAMAVSDEEADLLRRERNCPRAVWTVPNGVDPDYFSPRGGRDAGDAPPRIVICASFSAERNAHAARWFADAMLPKVRETVPDAEYWIVGRSPPDSVKSLERRPGITVTGTVDDVRPYYERARVVVLPYRFGAGTRLKALEAMAMARALVTTPNGCRGIRAEDGRHLLVADSEEAFADRCTELLTNGSRRGELGERARRLVLDEYTWAAITGHLGRRLRELVGSA